MATILGAHQAHGLLRVLGLGFGVAMVVGGTIGVGILRAPGPVAGFLHLPWLIVGVWLAAGAVALMGANTFAELAASIPRAGGPYAYNRRAYGDFTGFVSGWADVFINVVAAGYMAVVASEYLRELLPALPGVVVTAPALIALLAVLNSFGTRESGWLMQLVTLLKVLMLLGVVIAAFTGRDRTAAFTGTTVAASPSGLAMVLALQLAMETYAGWNSCCYFAEETHDPGRNVPRSLFAGVLIVTVVYVGINLALLHVLGSAGVAASKLAGADAVATVYGPQARGAIVVLALVCVLCILNSVLLFSPRIVFGMARDGMLPTQACYVTPRGTPLVASWTIPIAAMVFAVLGTFEVLFAIGATLGVINDGLCYGALFVLRRREPELARPFHAVGYPWLPGLVLLVSLSLLAAYFIANPMPTLVTTGLLLLGWPLFLAMRRRMAAVTAVRRVS